MGALFGIAVRHTLTFLGGAAAYIGAIDASKIQLVAGVIASAVGVALSYVNKSDQKSETTDTE